MRLFWLYRRQILALTLLSFISSAFLLALPYFSKLLMDSVFIAKQQNIFFRLSAVGAGLFLFSTLMKVIENTVRHRMTLKIKISLANKFIKKLYSSDIGFFQNTSAGENAYGLSSALSVDNLVLEQYPNLLAAFLKLPLILVIAFYLNTKMMLLFLVLTPFFILRNIYIRKKLAPVYEKMWFYSERLADEVHEALSNILIIKVFNLQVHQRRRYFKVLVESIRWKIKSLRLVLINDIAASFLSKFAYGALTLYGGWLILKGDITIGSYTAVMFSLSQLGGLTDSMGRQVEYFASMRMHCRKLFEIIDSKPLIIDAPGAKSIDSIKGQILFKDMHFVYPGGREIFRGINLTIPANSWVAVVGLSGCGKTTLINLILRLHNCYKGDIFLDELDLKKIKLFSLREKIALAAQQPFLFNTSIRENITYGLKDITREALDEAAEIACLSYFINSLPLGYDTVIGANGCRLSEGLKQRVAIARAMVRDTDLLILDEAASSVDFLTEEKIFTAIRKKRKGRATIVVSHRLASISDADRIYFLRDPGRIEEGRHEELLANSLSYCNFFQNQIQDAPVFQIKN